MRNSNASAHSKKPVATPARFNLVTQHLQEVQINRQKQAVAGLGVSRVRDPAANSKNENI